jgi:hypothetical protein
MRRFFISYRRDDAEADAGRIADRFRSAFGDDAVFFDTLAIEGGDRWMDRINAALSEAEVMLVVIGKSWLTLAGSDGKPRIQSATDVVGGEIARAIDRGIRVIPVRVQGASLPSADALPPSLSQLPDFNDHEVRSGPAFDRDVESLVDVASGRRRGWRRWLPRSARGIALAFGLPAVVLSVVVLAQFGMMEWPAVFGSDTSQLPPAPEAFDLQLQVKLDEAAGDDGKTPEMKLWHRRPTPPGRADHIYLLDKAREVGHGEFAYLSPIPTMPAQGDSYDGQLHRVMRTGQANLEPTDVCFKANLAAKNKEPLVKMNCQEGAKACVIAEDDFGWAQPCAPGKPVTWFPFMSEAFAAGAEVTSWAVPSLATLGRPDNAGRAYSEVNIQSPALPMLKDASTFTYALFMNGQPLRIDGLPPDAYPQAFDATKGIDLSFGLENLDASGRVGGYEDLRVQLKFMAGERMVRSAELSLRYVALRTIEGPLTVSDGDISVNWRARYHPGRQTDNFQIFITSSPQVRGLELQKSRFDQAGLKAKVAGRESPLVAVLRPPLDGNTNYGLNLGLREPNGQIRFTFDDAASTELCLAMNGIAATRSDLVRSDSYRRTLDGKKGFEQCVRFSAR